MRLLNYLQEEYETSIKVRNEQVPVFINPTRKEIDEIKPSIRFIIDPLKRIIYTWNADLALHDSMIKKLKLNKARFITLGQGKGNKDNFHIFDIVNRGKLSREEYEKLDANWIKKIFSKISLSEWLHDGWVYGLKGLSEEYVCSYQDIGHRNILVFKNPVTSDFRDYVKNAPTSYSKEWIRFIANCKRKELWMFSSDTFHTQAAFEIEKETGIYLRDNNSFYGLGKIKGNKILLSTRDAENYYLLKNGMYEDLFDLLKDKLWKWSDKYFTGKTLSQWMSENR